MAKHVSLDDLFAAWQALLPLDDSTGSRLRRKFTVEYNYNSNHLEGNTLTYGQTELMYGGMTENG